MKGIRWDGRPVEVRGDGWVEIPYEEGLRRVAPGLTDIQVNGFGGVDFNDPEIGYGDYVQALRALWEHRVTCAVPTLITNGAARIREQLERLEEFRKRSESERKSGSLKNIAFAPYYHLEGPFISPEEGYRGAHPLEDVLSTEDSEAEGWLSRWQKAAGGRIRIMTFSPHAGNVSRFISTLKDFNILAAIGHTHANSEQIHASVRAGAVLATHLGNACAQFLPRHANPIWSVLAEDELSVSMIGDGFHLPPEMLKTFYRVKGRGRILLISDATQYAGKTPGAYHTHIGGDVILTPERKLHIAGSPNVLAGAAKSLWEGWKYVSSLGFASPEECWYAGSGAPLKLLTGREIDSALCPLVFVDEG